MRIDHVLHFLGAWLLVDALESFTGLYAAMLAALIVAAAKELIFDLAMDRGDPDPLDFLASTAGVAFGALEWSGALLVLLWAFWVLYVFTMGLYRAFLQKRLKGLTLFMCAPFVAVALVLDFAAQVTVFTVVFLDPPTHLLVTNRLRAYMAGPEGWRRRLADYICKHLLDPFDPTGAHCDSKQPALKA